MFKNKEKNKNKSKQRKQIENQKNNNNTYAPKRIFWNGNIFGMKLRYVERNCIIWNKIEIVRIKINKKECAGSVPMRNVPLQREDTINDYH